MAAWRASVGDEAQAGDIRSYDMTQGLGRTYRYLTPDAEPLYPFGYGLSYTSWRYSELRASSVSSAASVRGVPGSQPTAGGAACTCGEDEVVVVRLNLTNSGEVDGAEVALHSSYTPPSPLASCHGTSAVRACSTRVSDCTSKTYRTCQVAQLYVGFLPTFAPRTDISAYVPAKQLAGFTKVFLRAGCDPTLRSRGCIPFT